MMRYLGLQVPTSRKSRITPATLMRRFAPGALPEPRPRWRRPLWPVPGLPPRPGARAEGASLGQIGPLEVRLARTAGEVRAAQRLRYQVFYEEMSAVPNMSALFQKRDFDEFDPLCDHVLVLDHDAPHKGFGRRRPRVVGTYRLLRQEIADLNHGFYTAGEYDIEALLERKSPGLRYLELGRSCVLKPYRNKRTVELLWQGVWSYILMHRMDVIIGCASLEGTDPERLALPLSFLHHNALAPEDWRVRALPERAVAMDRLPKEQVNARAALQALPPLIKGYLRLGAYVGEGAVVDHQFGTTDVFMIMPVERISERYITYFGPAAGRHAS